MWKSVIIDSLIPIDKLASWFLSHLETLDEAGKQRLWERMDMDNYDPREMEPSVLKDSLEKLSLEMKKDLDPEGPYMQSIFKEIDEEVDWITTPWWKKVLVKVGVMKKVTSRTVEHGESILNNHSK